MPVRRKCFISYHHADEWVVNNFIGTFDHGHDVFIARGIGQEMTQDVIDSTDADYVMRRIREIYVGDSTVTIVMLGRCTWARRYVDWEIQASLRPWGAVALPNGLLGIKLGSFTTFPERFNNNLIQPGRPDHYAGHIPYPASADILWSAIEWAYQRRSTHAHLVNNPRDRFTYNRECR